MTMSDVGKCLISAGIATTQMTLFSIFISLLINRNYCEPSLLQYVLVHRVPCSRITAAAFGWFIHYVIGAAFVFLFYLLWTHGLKMQVYSNILLGLSSGMMGVVIWYVLHRFDRSIKELYQRPYYAQLIVAHLVFAATASTVYSWLKSTEITSVTLAL